MQYSLSILAAATSLASCSSLSQLDSHDASSLASVVAPNGDGIAVGGWLRTRYANSSDVDTDLATAGEQDLGGFSLDSARLNFSGTLDGDWGFNASIEGGHQGLLDTGTSGVTVLDAYATVPLGEHVHVVIGRFGSNFLWSANVEERKQLFFDRTFAAENTDNRDTGLEFSGSLNRFNWWAAMQNGSDGAGDKSALSGRASYRILGEPCTLQEGCCESTGDVTQLILGAAYFDDANLDDGSAVAADAWFFHAPFSAFAEVVNWGDDIRPLPGVDTLTGTILPVATGATGCETTSNLTLGYLLVPERWEVAARYQDLDDAADTSIASFALNRYFAQHSAKCTLQFDTSDSDLGTIDVDVLTLGLTVGI